MSSGVNNFKSSRGFGDFAPANSASSLFDAAFSKPVPRKRLQKFAVSTSSAAEDAVLPSVSDDSRNSPKQVFSPPVSLPESNSTDGAFDLENEDEMCTDESASRNISSDERRVGETFEDPKSDSQSSTSSINRLLDNTSLDLTKKTIRPRPDAYDFDEEKKNMEPQIPPSKKRKEEIMTAKFIPAKERRPVYQHKWVDGDEDEDKDVDFSSPLSTNTAEQSTSKRPWIVAGAMQPRVPVYARESSSRVRNVKEAHQCLESGEHDDFKQDLEYILSTLRGDGDLNVKCLSVISLARKCIYSEFRQFVRSEGQVNNVFRSMSDAPQDQCMALCAATVIYLMSRDFISMKVDGPSLRLFSQLLRVEKLGDEPNQKKYKKLVWKVFEEYLHRMESAGKKVVFDITEESLAPSYLILEALVFVLARSSDDGLKSELLNLGVLQWVVSKVEKVVLSMLHGTHSKSDTAHQLLVLERCFRILESCTLYHKKNQAFLISHRGSVLIQMSGKLMSNIHKSVPQCPPDSILIRSYMTCLSLMARVLMNMSHENELCSTKLGQMPGFLSDCLNSFTFLAPKFASEDKKFDMCVMISSLLVNLVERCNSNRRKIIDTTVIVYSEGENESTEKGLEALTKLFSYHEAKARNIDEDLDKDLAFEDPTTEETKEEDSDDENEGTQSSGRLDRAKLDDMSEGEILNVVQNAMGKASAHMEDSVVASYIALLIGCVLQQNEECVSSVRAHLTDGSVEPMIDQLQRFLEFMKIATSKSNGCRSIERIIDLLEKLR